VTLPILQIIMTAALTFIASALGVYGVMRYFQGKTEARLTALEDGREVNADDIKSLEKDVKGLSGDFAVIKTEHKMFMEGKIPHGHRLGKVE
jgi:hypothetical protein